LLSKLTGLSSTAVWIGLSGYNKNDPVKILEDALYLISAVLK